MSFMDVRKAVRYAFPWLGGGTQQPRSRQELYADLEEYYYGSVYARETAALIGGLSGWSGGRVTGMINPVKRIVDFYRDYTMSGDVAGPEEGGGEEGEEGGAGDGGAAGQGGGRPKKAKPEPKATILTSNPALIAPILDILRWSNFPTWKSLLALYAANLGDALLVAQEDADGGMVWLEARHPGELTDCAFDQRGQLVYARLESMREEWDEKARRVVRFRYGREYTATEYRTLRDGREAPVDGARSRWPNPHGFVPVRIVRHLNDGGDFGLNAYHAAIPAVNEINVRASQIGDIIGQHAAALWAIFGAAPPVGQDGNETEVDRGKMLFLPTGSDAKPLVAELQIEQAWTHIDRLVQELKDSYPELTLPELQKKGGEMSGVAVRNMLLGAIKRGENAQESMTADLVAALKMCLLMGRNLAGTGTDIWAERYPGADLGNPAAGAWDDLDIKWLDILPLSDLERMQLDSQREALTDEIEGRRQAREGGDTPEGTLGQERRRQQRGA